MKGADVYAEETLRRFLDDLAAGTPTPGGGSSAALIGAVGAGLVSMAAQHTAGREKYKDVDEEARRILERSEAARAEFVRLIQGDINAFGEVSAAYKLPRASDEEKAARSEAIQTALIVATETPLAVARAAVQTLGLAEAMAAISNPQVVSDVGAGAIAADASFQASLLNVEINLASMKDAERVSGYRKELEQLHAARADRLANVLAKVRERL